MKHSVINIICVFLALFLGFNFTHAYDKTSEPKERSPYDFKKVTDDERIVSALKVLEDTDSYDVLERIFQKNKNGKYVRIIFYDLGMISYEYKNHYAMACEDNFEEEYIIINAKYRNSPKEALAALVVHESLHRAKEAALGEEINATIAELNQWNKSLVLQPKLQESDNPLVKRLNDLSKLYDKGGEAGIKAVSQKITGNEFYRARFDVGNI